MKFCKKCISPATRPDLEFDEQGVCDACRMAESKMGQGANPIDWEARKEAFGVLVEKARSNDHEKYDCIIPVSGGKDSTFQVHVAKNVYGLRPLCICFEPTLPTEVGRENLDNLNRMGVDLLHIKRNPLVYEKMVIEGFKRVGDMEWPNHVGIWTTPYRFAVAFDIPLILWGEGRMEFAGNFWIDEKHLREMDEDFINDFGGMNGLRPQDLVSEGTGIGLDDIKMYTMPPKEKIAAIAGNRGCVGVFLGYYFLWDTRSQLAVAEEQGFKRNRGRIETTYSDFEKLDCVSMHLHDYLKYCKFGYGRATDEASRDIRHNFIDRDEGVRLVERWDGHYPIAAVSAFCEKFGISRAEFDRICDGFTNKAIFETRDRKFCRDIDDSLIMKKQWIENRRSP
ncbi:MAG: N-acetyl sugar amidotransferase [Alphaproteobacteria bacterium]|nr:N-acetyl sugar amidotransferase [Alphaproteobacteria bacterium]